MPNASPDFVSLDEVSIPQQAIAELVEGPPEAEAEEAAAAALTTEVVEQIKVKPHQRDEMSVCVDRVASSLQVVEQIKVKPRLCESFTKVWDTRGTLCQVGTEPHYCLSLVFS